MEHVSSSVTLVELKSSLIPPAWEDTVRRVGMSECREIGLSLAHSFAADDLSQYLLGADDMAHLTPEQKWRLHVDMMTYIAAAHFIKGIVTTIGPEHDCVSVWLPPGIDVDGWWIALRSGLWRMYYLLSAEGRKRYFQELLPLLHDAKLEVMGSRDADCYYLVYLGTKPKARGQGYATRLLRDMARVADAENRPIYLESSSPSNTRYYKRFGFEVKKDIVLTRGCEPVLLSAMVREPQPRDVTYQSCKFQGRGQDLVEK